MIEQISIEDAQALVANALIAANTAPDNALAVAEALVAAEIDGQKGHGLSRVLSYAAQSASGKVDGHAVPVSEALRPGFFRIDARNGFAYPALELAQDRVSEAAAITGIACAAITRSHHAGQAGRVVERLAERDCVALMVANTPKAMAPWGGGRAFFGTNPIAFAAPRRENVPLVIDLSLSKVARGKIMAAKRTGEPIPEGWALDAEGRATTDAEAALAGTMVPMGDAKGAVLALLVEILAAALTGANFSRDASSFFEGEGPPPGTGQCLIAIDIRATVGDGFLDRMDSLAALIEAEPGARLPGMSRIARRAAAVRDGLTAERATMEDIRALLA